ncbi:MmcQ/YjbR family DNA-binding protein [Microbacterium sp. NPDC055903]
MDGVDLLAAARSRVEELPGAVLENPFGPETDVYKVRGKVFLLLSGEDADAMLVLKSHPEDSEALRRGFAEITPGYHMNKRHWISVRPGPALESGLVAELVTESYLLVVEKLPRARRPVDPALFGAR